MSVRLRSSASETNLSIEALTPGIASFPARAMKRGGRDAADALASRAARGENARAVSLVISGLLQLHVLRVEKRVEAGERPDGRGTLPQKRREHGSAARERRDRDTRAVEPERASVAAEKLEQRAQVLRAFGVTALRIAEPVIEGDGGEPRRREQARNRRVGGPVLRVLGAAGLEDHDGRTSPLVGREVDVRVHLRAAHLFVNQVPAHANAIHARDRQDDGPRGVGLRRGRRNDESEGEMGDAHGVLRAAARAAASRSRGIWSAT